MSKSIKAGFLGVAFAVMTALPVGAVPIALYDASIDVTLSLVDVSVDSGTGPADVDVFGDAIVSFEDAFSSGDASSSTGGTGASPAFPTSMETDPISIDVKASGSATGIGFADSIRAADGFVDIFNFSSTNTVKLDFELDYSLSASASVLDTFLQAAGSTAFFSLSSSQEFDPLLEFDLFADTDLLEPGGTVADVFTFSIFLEPLTGATLSILADASGFLTSDLTGPPPSEIPIPAMAPLFGLGALGLFLKGRRRKAR